MSNALEASYAAPRAPVVFRAMPRRSTSSAKPGCSDAHLEKLYRDVKILDIGEGTQWRLVIARQLFDFPRDA